LKNAFIRHYRSSFILLAALLVGTGLGFLLKEKAAVLKPFGDIFLNLLFTAVVPLVFFSIASAVASMASGARLGKILGAMMVIFIATGIVSSLLMVAAVLAYPPAQGIELALGEASSINTSGVGESLVRTFTVGDFGELLSKKNMLALIVFSVLIGLAASRAGEKGRAFTQFLVSANEVFAKVIGLIMLYAPVGLGAYFAYLTGVFGSQLSGSYLRAVTLYYPLAFGYFLLAFTFYAWLAAGPKGTQRFWSNIIPTALTALATGSSLASVPVNLEAARKNGVPEDIRDVVIPIGATVHMEGSCLSAVLKIAFLFGIFRMDFSDPAVLLSAVGVALLSGTVMSGIPSGGFLGEVLIVTLYGFPVEALPLISMIGVLVDPPATMVNACGDNVACLLIARLLGGPQWLKDHEQVA
jgi:Na+/H+-dicarboxylate symporter